MATKKQINALERACTAYEEKNDADASGFEWYTNTETDSSVTWKFKDFPAIVAIDASANDLFEKGKEEYSIGA